MNHSQTEINLIAKLSTAPMEFISMELKALFELLIRCVGRVGEAVPPRDCN